MNIRVFILLGMATLVGCETTSSTKTVNKDEEYIKSEVAELLTTLAEKVVITKEITMKHQAAMARLNAPEDGYPDVYNEIPEGLEKSIPIPEFYGDAEAPLKLIATLTNYRFSFRGAKPNGVTWVKLSKQDTPAIELITDIYNQIQKNSIDIDIYPTPNLKQNGVILLSYPGAND